MAGEAAELAQTDERGGEGRRRPCSATEYEEEKKVEDSRWREQRVGRERGVQST